MEVIVGGAPGIGAVMAPGVRAGAYYGMLPPEEPTIASSGPPAHWKWDARMVGEWLADMGLKEYRETFVAHRITGDLLEAMEKDDLRDLGISLVGHRLLLLREIAALRRTAESRERSKLLWQADEVVHRSGPLGYVHSLMCCQPCLHRPDRYTLTGSALIILAKESKSSAMPWLLCCSGESSTTRSIELGSVAGVTAHEASSWWDCGLSADEVVVSLNMELGLPPLPPLAVQSGSGRKVAQIIQAALEQHATIQAAHAAGHGPVPTTPPPQVMARGSSFGAGPSSSSAHASSAQVSNHAVNSARMI